MTRRAGRGRVALLIGPPGSGKGTQATSVCQVFDYVHVSTGDLLRAEVAAGSPLGLEVEPIMRAGALVPDDVVERIIAGRLAECGESNRVLLDGFPRTVAQATALDSILAGADWGVDLVVALDVPEVELRARLARRSALAGRPDDAGDAVSVRLDIYARETAPLVNHYRAAGADVRTVDGVGSIYDVGARVAAACSATQAGTSPRPTAHDR